MLKFQFPDGVLDVQGGGRGVQFCGRIFRFYRGRDNRTRIKETNSENGNVNL